MRSVRRTNPQVDGLFALADAMGGKTPDQIITAQEKQGQTDIVNSDVLPTDLNFDRDGSKRKAMEAMGIVFGDVVPNDPLFQYVTLPTGWKKQPTEHDMWSHVCDENGRERIAVFYKAAFYDRKAHMAPVCRFYYSTDYDVPYYSSERDAGQHGVVRERHTDGTERIIWRSEKMPFDQSRESGRLWLEEHFPDYESVLAYWDVPVQEFTGYTIE